MSAKIAVLDLTILDLVFFMHCWDVIKDDLVKATIEFFSGTSLPKFYSSTFIVIPNEEKSTRFAKLRPISLCPMIYKIFSKIIVNRLNPLLAKIVSKGQGAFIRGHNIQKNITLA